MSQIERKRCKLTDTASNISAGEATVEDDDQFKLLLRQLDVESENNNLAYTIRRTMLEIAQIKERNCERRHRELMALLKNNVGGDSSNDCRTNAEENVGSSDAHVLIRTETSDSKEEETDSAKCTPTTTIEPNVHQTMAASSLQNHKNEYHEQRQRLIAVQKQKMADRERKKREQETSQ